MICPYGEMSIVLHTSEVCTLKLKKNRIRQARTAKQFARRNGDAIPKSMSIYWRQSAFFWRTDVLTTSSERSKLPQYQHRFFLYTEDNKLPASIRCTRLFSHLDENTRKSNLIYCRKWSVILEVFLQFFCGFAHVFTEYWCDNVIRFFFAFGLRESGCPRDLKER